MGNEITSQLLVQPRAIGIASSVLFGFSLIPGLPTLPFLMLVGVDRNPGVYPFKIIAIRQ